jgi:D-alanine-D-alanine ligase
VFPVLHGPNGEDGTVQGMLALYDLPCVGSGCAASAVAMDKIRTRQALQSAGVPMPRAFTPPEPLGTGDERAAFAALEDAVGLPCFAKVACSGSSRGVERIAAAADFERFWRQFGDGESRWLAERAVRGEELTVPVLGNDDALQALPPVGIYPRFSSHFDERAKYDATACEELVPPRGWTSGRIEHVQQLAVLCHRVLGCAGMSRTDMIWGPDGPVVLEVNTIPGLTATSLLPKAAAAAGYSFASLLDHLLELALAARSRPAVVGPVVSR